MFLLLFFFSSLACVHSLDKPTKSLTTPASPARENFFVECGGGGPARIKAVAHGTYLAVGKDGEVVTITNPKGDEAQWIIEKRESRVVFKTTEKPGRYLRGWHNQSVNLAELSFDYEMWKQFKNKEGSWCFKDVHDGWLSALDDGTVRTVIAERSWTTRREYFRCEPVKTTPEKDTNTSPVAGTPEITTLTSPTTNTPRTTITTTSSTTTATESLPITSTPLNKYFWEECGGLRRTKSVAHGTYISKLKDGSIGMVAEPKIYEARWNIKLNGDKAVFEVDKITRDPALYLRTYRNHTAGLIGLSRDYQSFKLVKNRDGSWSLLDDHLGCLTANDDGTLSIPYGNRMEQTSKRTFFRCEPITEAPQKDPTPSPVGQTPETTTNMAPTTRSTATPSFTESTTPETVTDQSLQGQDQATLKAEFFAECGGDQSLKSVKLGTYLAVGKDNEIIFARNASKWTVEERDGRAVFKARDQPPRYLRDSGKGEFLVELSPQRYDYEMWKIFKNEDASWSFRSVHSGWLTDVKGKVRAHGWEAGREHFVCEKW